jgi:aarF domain-containing kinase
VEADPVLRANRFVVPDAVPELSTDQILTSEFRPGGTIDKVTNLSQDERNRIGRAIMYLTMKELFVWRFMQTDPNWGNFLYDMGTGTTSLIDFGAAREYSKSFVDGYLRIVWASANRDEGALMEQSYRMNFLTGEENEQMLRAHKLSGYTVGELSRVQHQHSNGGAHVRVFKAPLDAPTRGSVHAAPEARGGVHAVHQARSSS